MEQEFWIPEAIILSLAVLTGFQNKNSFIPDSTSKNFPDSGMRILLHVETFGKKYGLGKQN